MHSTREPRWYACALLSGSKGCGFDSRHCLVLFFFSKTLYPHCMLSTQLYKWVPGRMRTLFVAWCGMCAPLKWRLARMLPGSWEGALWVQDWYWIQWPGVIIQCKAFWVIVYHTRKALYKNQLLYYYCYYSVGSSPVRNCTSAVTDGSSWRALEPVTPAMLVNLIRTMKRCDF